ncbi:MAG: DsrE family protein [Chromatiales bacterium]|nr:DsrE family protein [Chromatiales bacterium]
MRIVKIVLATLALTALAAQNAYATHSEHSAEKHRVVIQVSSGDEATQSIAMNNAVNLQKELGIDNVSIEIVAYGPGLSMLFNGGKQSERVSSLAKQEITFSACGNTMKKVEKKQGKPVVLAEGVGVVPGGVIRIMELQEQGYSYIRP